MNRGRLADLRILWIMGVIKGRHDLKTETVDYMLYS